MPSKSYAIPCSERTYMSSENFELSQDTVHYIQL